MFKSAVVRLTAWYMLGLFLVCVFFSVAIYQVSSREINRGLNDPNGLFQPAPGNPGMFPNFRDRLRQAEHQQALASQSRLNKRLILSNLFVLALGGAAAYLFAKETLKPIEKAHESQRRFTADASHELRTPLTAMKTEIEVALADEKFGDKDSRALLTSVLEEADKLGALATSLLEISQLDETEIPLSSINAQDPISSAVESVKMRADAKNISIETSSTEAAVKTNEPALQQILVVLLDNAIKYSDQGNQVRVSSEQQRGSLQIKVEDHGRGIAAADLVHIFDRFYRADPARTSTERGYGLGLSLAKRLADKIGAEISVASTPDVGSTFTVSVPQ